MIHMQKHKWKSKEYDAGVRKSDRDGEDCKDH